MNMVHFLVYDPKFNNGETEYRRRFMHIAVRQGVYSSVRPEKRYGSNPLRISDIGMKFIVEMHSTMQQVDI